VGEKWSQEFSFNGQFDVYVYVMPEVGTFY
jgi:hypothetical protein